jgi:transcriptional regulator with XRE-family HTH domain
MMDLCCHGRHVVLICISMNTKEVGELIRKRRASLQIDQSTLGALSGIAVHTLSNIEAGRGNPTLATLNQVLDTLGMELRIEVKQ